MKKFKMNRDFSEIATSRDLQTKTLYDFKNIDNVKVGEIYIFDLCFWDNIENLVKGKIIHKTNKNIKIAYEYID